MEWPKTFNELTGIKSPTIIRNEILHTRFATVSLKHGARKLQEGNPYPPKYLLVTSYFVIKGDTSCCCTTLNTCTTLDTFISYSFFFFDIQHVCPIDPSHLSYVLPSTK